MQQGQTSGSEPFWNGADPGHNGHNGHNGNAGGAGKVGELALAGLVDRLPAATYVANPGAHGQWLYASPQIRDILGFGAEDFIADSGLWERQLHPADRERVLQSEDAIRSQGRSRQEYRMIGKDGRVVWLLDDALISEVAQHGIVQHGLLYEITERKRTEMLLAQHADILERVARGDAVADTLAELAAATEAISGTGRCVIEVSANAGLLAPLLLSSSGELTADQLAELLPAFHEAFFAAPDGSRLGRVSLHYPDGRSGLSEDDELAGWAAGLAAVAVVRAAANAEVSNSMSLLQATLDSTADGILVVSADGRVLGFNQKMVELWRLDPAVLEAGRDDELRASVLSQLVDPNSFTRGVDRLMAAPMECSFDELEFLDGRHFERYSQPQLIDGKPVGRVWSFRDMTLHRQLEQELRQKAFSDPLTPLPNRAYFISELTAALASARRPERSVAVLLLDLDDFKTVNDSLGHGVGDGLLVAVAERLQNCLRAGDIAARLGGDEFVVMLDRLKSPQDAVYAAERLLAAVSRPLQVDGQLLTIRASIGIATPLADENASDLVRNADLAMYIAKRDGGGRCQRFEPSMHADALARLELKADLERALDNDELVVHYQPVVDLRSFEVVSVEALVRWPHPRRGLIPPNDFVPLAEESRLIDRLGSSVLRQACSQLALWRKTIPNRRKLTVSVNLSPRQLSEDGLAEDVRQALWVAGLPPSALALEITETSLASPNVDAVTVLRELKQIGVALALDDFGVGYSSLGHLVNFPLDVVKIDKSFVDPVGSDPGSAALLKAVLQVVAALSLSATVEGVEDPVQLRKVIELGCHRAQGYLLSRPLDAQACTELLTGPLPDLRAADW